MSGRRVLLVLRKEVTEALRDRRTLFVTLVLPMLLYPALMIGLGTVSARQQTKLRDQVQAYAVAGPVPEALRKGLAETRGLLLAERSDPEAALRAREVRLVVRASPDFPEVLAKGGTARLELVHDSADEASAEARRKAMEAVEKYRGAILQERLARAGIERAYIQPVDVPASAASDIATATRRGAHLFGRMLSFMLVVMMATGSFSPAVDAVAGEKERGTMETLLVCPATRLEVVLGKFLSIFAVAIATALGNLLSMGITFGQLASSLGVRGKIDFAVDAGTAATIFAVLLPLGALFAALALALSTLARSTKEAQTYLTPLLLLAMPLSMVSVIPNVELSFGLASVPVSGAVLLFRDLMLAQGEPALMAKALPMVPVVLGTTALAAGLAIRWAVWMFEREEVLFRDPGVPFQWRDLRPVRRAGALPGPGAAIFLPAAALAATYLLGGWFVKAENIASLPTVLLPQAAIFASVVAGIGIGGMDPRVTLGLRTPSPAAMAGALLVGCGGVVAIPWLIRVTGLEPPRSGGVGDVIEAFVRAQPLPVLVLVVGIVPAILEEAMFRGWVLRGLRTQIGAGAAILLSSVVFGAFHLEPERVLFTGALGAAFGFLALRTGSIAPGMLAHALNNSLLVVLSKDAKEGTWEVELLTGSSPALGFAGLAAAAAGLVIAWLSTRPGRDSLPAESAGR